MAGVELAGGECLNAEIVVLASCVSDLGVEYAPFEGLTADPEVGGIQGKFRNKFQKVSIKVQRSFNLVSITFQ